MFFSGTIISGTAFKRGNKYSDLFETYSDGRKLIP